MVIGVNTGEQGDPAPKARQFRDKHRLTYPILVDQGGHVAQRYGVFAFPTNLVVDRKGVVRLAGAGFDPSGVEQTINALLGGQVGRAPAARQKPASTAAAHAAAITCARHLEAIGRAIDAYQKEKGELPARLSDLYPRYLTDKALLHCPADRSPGEPGYQGVPADPNLPISYLYEMSLEKNPGGLLLGPGPTGESATWRKQKMAQREWFGERVPVVRCWHHALPADLLPGETPFVLNLTPKGEVYRSGELWETDPGTVPAVLSAIEKDLAAGPETFQRHWSSELVAEYFNNLPPLPALRNRLHSVAGQLADLAKTDAGKTDGDLPRAIESITHAAGGETAKR